MKNLLLFLLFLVMLFGFMWLFFHQLNARYEYKCEKLNWGNCQEY